MIGWLVAIAYVVIWLVSGRYFAINMLHNAQVDLLRHLESLKYSYPTHDKLMEEFNRTKNDEAAFNAFIGLCLGSVWPFVLPFTLFAKSLRTPFEKELAEGAELAALRQLAKDNGLSFPEVKS